MTPQPEIVGSQELRRLVREVLREIVPTQHEGRTPGRQTVADADARVRVNTDVDLQALVVRIAELCADPRVREQLRSGERRFRLAVDHPSDPSPFPPGLPERATGISVQHGVVTDRLIRQAAKAGAVIRISDGVIVTPLARDSARRTGVRIEKAN